MKERERIVGSLRQELAHLEDLTGQTVAALSSHAARSWMSDPIVTSPPSMSPPSVSPSHAVFAARHVMSPSPPLMIHPPSRLTNPEQNPQPLRSRSSPQLRLENAQSPPTQYPKPRTARGSAGPSGMSASGANAAVGATKLQQGHFISPSWPQTLLKGNPKEPVQTPPLPRPLVRL